MSAKNALVTQLFSASNNPIFSLSTSFTSPITVVRNLDNCSYQINVTTTDSDGTFQVQVSNDYYVEPNTNVVVNPGNWVALTLTSSGGPVPTVSATSTIITINLNQLPFYATRLAYISTTAGTGTALIYVADKRIGG